jgi:AhpD family alkylhydroperoxidase
MSKDAILNTIEKEMIALGASVAAGCQPCTLHHIEAAGAAGTCDKGMTLAVTVAADVRRAAAEAMASWGIEQLGGTMELPDDWLTQRKLIRALVSAAAAFAVNSVPEFRRYAEEAHHHGATDRQIQLAITIARKIKGVASEKIESVAQQLLADYQPEEHLVGGRCGCPA